MRNIFYISMSMLLASSVSAKDEDETPINSATELRKWCKAESAAYFVAKDKTPYNWTATWKTKGNMLFVKGKWRVDGERKLIECRIIIGAKRKYASLDISTP